MIASAGRGLLKRAGRMIGVVRSAASIALPRPIRARERPNRRRRSARRMALVLILLVLLMAAYAAPDQARAADAAPPFDSALTESVVDTALTVLRPRTLEPHSAAELTLWGLNGFTAIDPALTVSSTPKQVILSTPQGTLFTAPRPAEDDAAGWAALMASMAQAAWTASPAVQQAGQQAVIQNFFDELFNHLDPYSRYVAPAPAETDRTARIGGTASAGLTLVRQGRQLVVSTVNANGPAWTAGINAGMRLLSIDGQSVRDMTPADAANLMLGDPGSKITLVLAEANGRHETRYTLDRAQVPPETVFAFSNNDIVILRVTAFSADTAQEISQFLEQAMEPDPHRPKLHGLIFDLRGNRGGVLQQAVTSVALVLDHGVAVTAKGRDPQANHVWAVQGGDLTDGVPIVVLVDGRTASAAEIMAAALADQRRAVVVGSSTLGKGLVQYIAQMPDGGELFVTWSRVLAPLGWPLQGLGVMPQVCTSLGQADLDRQLQDLSDGVFDQRAAVMAEREARSPLPTARILELRSHCPAAIGGDADLDAARTLLDTPGAYRAALVPALPDRRVGP
ncbi:S41 family peptidase [Acetobacteraceae bacterium KSS8]|uniref:S41 family peptidase n=1 Tax=Endosaccharibacter trunci TaxID=2812733 RepID=A0ABT1W9S0_9PROT|nr:S41 family peptidase [Acetobacteraceae bacterium KSS8]